MAERMAEIGDWSIFQGVVVFILIVGFYFIERVLKDIRDTVNTIRLQQRGIFDDYSEQAKEWLNRKR